jgi:hypothetical protein
MGEVRSAGHGGIARRLIELCGEDGDDGTGEFWILITESQLARRKPGGRNRDWGLRMGVLGILGAQNWFITVLMRTV